MKRTLTALALAYTLGTPVAHAQTPKDSVAFRAGIQSLVHATGGAPVTITHIASDNSGELHSSSFRFMQWDYLRTNLEGLQASGVPVEIPHAFSMLPDTTMSVSVTIQYRDRAATFIDVGAEGKIDYTIRGLVPLLLKQPDPSLQRLYWDAVMSEVKK